MSSTAGTGENGQGSTLFFANRQLLQPGLRAPVLLAENPKRSFQAIFRQLLALHEVNPVLVEPAAVTGGSMLYGCQDLLLACHDLVASQDRRAVRDSCDRLVTACREVSGNLDSAYILMQVADELASRAGDGARQDSPCSRLKHLAALLEDFFVSPPFGVRLGAEELGQLQVHLDEVYDEACRQLESFYLAVLASPAPAPLAEFCREFYRGVTRRLVPDHILVDRPRANAPEGSPRSLLELVPELAESVVDRD